MRIAGQSRRFLFTNPTIAAMTTCKPTNTFHLEIRISPVEARLIPCEGKSYSLASTYFVGTETLDFVLQMAVGSKHDKHLLRIAGRDEYLLGDGLITSFEYIKEKLQQGVEMIPLALADKDTVGIQLSDKEDEFIQNTSMVIW